jgi:dihydroceramide fatty acyl 2-hydroxylase
MSSPRQGIRLFRNGVLEQLSHVHPAIPLLLWVPVVAWLLWRSVIVDRLETGALAVLGIAGLIVWSFAEYVLHRFVFHLAPGSPGRERLQFVMHGIHHHAPDDSTRWLMPPAPAIAGAAALFALFRIVLGPARVLPFFACFLIGYLVYDYTHFAIHHAGLRTRLGRYLRRRHMLHHFATPDARWGVTSPLWDWVFRTTGDRAVPTRVRRRRGPVGHGPLGVGAAVLVGVVLLLASPSAAEWEKLFDKLGVLVERRDVAGSSISEFRATATSSLAPSTIFAVLWRHLDYPAFIPHLKRLDLLSDTGDERITYEQVAVPLTSDRDYTVRLRKRVDPAKQRYEITFTSANDAGPPPDDRHVRVSNIHGSWTLAPGSGGKGAVIRYLVRTDPGGAIPAWLANRAQREAVVDLIRAVLARALTTSAPQ